MGACVWYNALMKNRFKSSLPHFIRPLLLLLCVVMAIYGCSPAQSAQETPAVPETAVSPAPVPTPEPSPTRAPMDAAQARAELISLFEQAFVIDVSPFLPDTMFDLQEPWSIFGTKPAEREWLPGIEASALAQIRYAAETAAAAFQSAHGGFSPYFELSGPSWQLMLTLIQSCGDAAEANALIARSVTVDAELLSPLPDEGVIRISVEPLPYREAMRLPDADEGAYLGRCFSYSYAYTVFGRDAMETDYVLPEAEGSLKSGIVWPLASHTRLRKTWYAARDGGKRRHTGTDIWAKADAAIYSCTNGAVTFVGEGRGMGYAVIVTDEYGYEFHYYHMIRLSDFLQAGDTVEAGELIGHVGNTGNSSLDHLHLTIVAPDGRYIDPYPYLEAVEP